MDRRDFLQAVVGAAIGGVTLTDVAPSLAWTALPKRPDVREFFESDAPEVLALAQRVFDKCILDKLQPPTPPLEHTWVRPGGPYYLGQWIWDTMFVIDLLGILPDAPPVIRDIMQNYWDFQDRWNRDAPDYARDMVTVAIKTAPQEVRQFSQIPLLAWGVERVFRRNSDRALLAQCLGRLERFHDWFWRERDLHDNGLIVVGAYSGKRNCLPHFGWEEKWRGAAAKR